jgi:cell division protein FtsB
MEFCSHPEVVRSCARMKRRRWVLLWERLLPLALLGTAVLGVPVLIVEPAGLPRLRTLGMELDRVESENEMLRRHIESLRGRVQHLREDPVAVERIARDELGLVRPNEVVFQFPRK